MEDPIHTEEYRGFTIRIYTDPDPESPREWDNLGHMITYHPRYVLGDAHIMSKEDLLYIVEKTDAFSLPLYIYDHSGIGMSTDRSRYPYNCPWDSSHVGYIYVTRKEVREEFGVKRISKKLAGRVLDVLRGEVAAFHQYIQGDVWGYVVGDQEEEHIDSCWGYYGYDACLQEAKQAVDFYAEERRAAK